MLTLIMPPALVFPAAVSDETERIVLTIGETTYRSAPRMSGEDQLGIWKYLGDQLGVEFRYVYMTEDE